jgi:hypothetical protein
VLLRGTLQWPTAVERDGRLTFREPLRDTLIPLVVVGGVDLLCCLGVAMNVPLLRIVCLLMAALLSFLVAALTVALFRRPFIEFDRAGGVVRFRGGPHGDRRLACETIASVEHRTVSDGAGSEADAVGLLLRDGSWVPLHVDWREPWLGVTAGATVARFLGVSVLARPRE